LLENQKSYEEVVTIPLISDTDGPNLATKANIKAVLDVLSGRKADVSAIPDGDKLRQATPDDLVLISFAGHGFGEGGRAIFEPQRSEVESGVIDRRHGGSGDAVQYYFFAVHRSVGFSDLTLPAFHRALKVLRAKWGMSRP